MESFQYVLTHSLTHCLVLVGILSLLVGSFLNVVIYRLPKMLMQLWSQESRFILDFPQPTPERFDLSWPPSHCTACQFPLLMRHNIPLLSFLFLRGRCADCHQPISWRYPFVEALTLIASLICTAHFGCSAQLIAALLFTWTLIPLIYIDIDTHLLPDCITLPLLWLGLLINTQAVFCALEQAVFGAIIGYASLWLLLTLFKRITGRDGMGQGDVKLLAVAGAWLGVSLLPITLVLASLSGAVIGSVFLISQGKHQRTPIAFGPFLAIAMWIALLYGDSITRSYWAFFAF